MNTCIYCGKQILNKGSLISHQLRCSKNPNAVSWPNKGGRKKGTGPPAWNKGLTKKTDVRVLQYAINLSKNDFLIKNVNPFSGITDTEKIKIVAEQNNVKIFILTKDQLTWEYIKTLR